MAFSFVSGSAQYMVASPTPVTTVPLTISAWFKPSVSNVWGSIVSVGGFSDHCRVSTGSGFLQGLALGSTTGSSVSTTALNAGVWYHVAAVFPSTSFRQSFLNGVPSTADTTLITQSPFDDILISARRLGGPGGLGQYINGDIGDVAIWNTALTDAEILSLSRSFAGPKIRPQNLVFYAPLIRPTQDLRSGASFINNGGTVSDHPRIIM